MHLVAGIWAFDLYEAAREAAAATAAEVEEKEGEKGEDGAEEEEEEKVDIYRQWTACAWRGINTLDSVKEKNLIFLCKWRKRLL